MSFLSSPGSGVGRQEPIFLGEEAFNKDLFVVSPHYKADIDSVLIPNGTIIDRIEKLAWDISEYYQEQEFHLLCVLKGSRWFFTHLTNSLNKIYSFRKNGTVPPYIEHYIRLKSYSGTESTNKLEVIGENLAVLKNKHVIIVEDIIDTGHTLTKFIDLLQAHNPKSVGIASLTEKRTPKSNGLKGDWVGFSVPDSFLVGFGLDYNEYCRDIPHICVLGRHGVERFCQANLDRHEKEGVPL